MSQPTRRLVRTRRPHPAGSVQRPARGTGLRLALSVVPGLALAAAAAWAFCELAGDVWKGEGFAFDQQAMTFLRAWASPVLTATLRLISTSASGLVIAGVTVWLTIRWWRRTGRRWETALLLITVAGSAALGQAGKLVFSRPRPQTVPWLTQAGGWSFPSGHALAAVTLGGLLAWLAARQVGGWRRVAAWAGAGLWAGLVGLSRVYLGVHYPSDVLASLAVGILYLLVTIAVYRTLVVRPAAAS